MRLLTDSLIIIFIVVSLPNICDESILLIPLFVIHILCWAELFRD